jgi:hypothetical protein
MSIVLAVVAVGLGSIAFRLLPLLTGRQVPASLARGATWAGMAVIAGITVRATLLLRDPSLGSAPVVALASVTVGLVIAFRGHSVLLAVAAGCASYVAVAAAVTGMG